MPSVTQPLAPRIKLAKPAPRMKIQSVKLIVAPPLVNTGALMERDMMALFGGALIMLVNELFISALAVYLKFCKIDEAVNNIL